MFLTYPAIFHKEDNAIWVEFPDLQGCQSYGETLEQTMEYAEEALGAYLAVMIEKNQEIPAPTDIFLIEKSNENEFTSYVSCDVNKYFKKTKAIKKTLSIPEWLNEAAEKKHLNFSRILQDALTEKLQSEF